MVFVEGAAEAVLGICDLLGSVEVSRLGGLLARGAVAQSDCPYGVLGGGHGVDDFEPRRRGDGLVLEDSVAQFVFGGLVDPCGPDLLDTHDHRVWRRKLAGFQSAEGIVGVTDRSSVTN